MGQMSFLSMTGRISVAHKTYSAYPQSKVLFWNKWRKKIEGEPANSAGLPERKLLKRKQVSIG